MIGQKDQRIRITTMSDSIEDPGGGTLPGVQVIYWETFAKVNTIKNKRDAESYQTDLEEPKEFIIRYREDKTVTKNMLIEHAGQAYTIQSNINVDSAKKELILVGLTRK
jgi:SPP1 family predicted phage head-tail adaptor